MFLLHVASSMTLGYCKAVKIPYLYFIPILTTRPSTFIFLFHFFFRWMGLILLGPFSLELHSNFLSPLTVKSLYQAIFIYSFLTSNSSWTHLTSCFHRSSNSWYCKSYVLEYTLDSMIENLPLNSGMLLYGYVTWANDKLSKPQGFPAKWE